MTIPWTPRLVASLQRGGVTDRQLRDILIRFEPRRYLAASDDELSASGCVRVGPVDGPEPDAGLLFCTGSGWPEWADRVEDPPAVLWHRGPIPPQRCGLAVVGVKEASGSYERVVAAACEGARAAGAPLWVDVTDAPTLRIAEMVGVRTILVGPAGLTGRGAHCCARTLNEAAARTADLALVASAAAVLCVVGGQARSQQSRAVMAALCNGAAVVVPAAKPGAAHREDLVSLVGSPDWFDLGRLGATPAQAAQLSSHAPLAHAVCANAAELTDAVRILALFSQR